MRTLKTMLMLRKTEVMERAQDYDRRSTYHKEKTKYKTIDRLIIINDNNNNNYLEYTSIISILENYVLVVGKHLGK